jgi:membrane protease YdiL (CAAX protease family)
MTGPLLRSSDRVTRAQFLRLSRWFTLALCLAAALLPLPFGQPGIWPALELTGLLTWQTLVSGILGLVIGAAVVIIITHWRPMHIIAKNMARLVAWETFRPADHVKVALMAALGEELLFRGALQPLIGLVPMALIFGVLHATAIAHTILAAVLGLWLGWLYQWTGSLWPPIAAHLTLDLATGLLLARRLKRDILVAKGD